MASSLDKTLDDLIGQNRMSNARGRSRSRSRGSAAGGPARRATNRNRSNPYTVFKAPDSAWQHDMYSNQMAAVAAVPSRAASIETGTKLNISNLDYGVSDEDIQELFAEMGSLKRSSINYDRSGRSLGTAVVVFARRQDALQAIARYHGVQLDGKPMKIELVERPPVLNEPMGNPNGTSKSGSGRGSSSSASQQRGGGGIRGRRAGRGRGRGRDNQITVKDLDADLEKYHAEAMQTN